MYDTVFPWMVPSLRRTTIRAAGIVEVPVDVLEVADVRAVDDRNAQGVQSLAIADARQFE